MILYHTDKYGRYNGVQTEAAENPNYTPETHDIADKYIYNNRTESLSAPLEVGENEASVLVNCEWAIVVDRMGQHYYEQDGEKVEITEVGADVPEGCIQVEPVSAYHTAHDGTEWVWDSSTHKSSVCAQVLAMLQEKYGLMLTYDGHDWQVDRGSQRSVQTRAAYAAANIENPVTNDWSGLYDWWLDVDDVRVPMGTAIDFQAFAKAVSDHCAGLFEAYQNHKIAVRFLSAYEDVRDYDMSEGWGND